MQATVHGIPIHYDEVGHVRPVIVVHGFSLNRQVMTHAYEPLFAGRPGWRRVYPDMPGHGRTPGPDWLDNEDQMLEVLEGFVQAVAGDERVVLIGASWGAYLMHALATRRPERVAGLAMVVPVVRADRTRRELPPRTVIVRDPVAVADVRPGEEIWLEASTVQTPEMLARFRTPEGVEPPDEAFLERLQPRYALSYEEGLTTTVEAPALIVAGRQDPIVGYRDAWRILEHLPRATFAILDRAAHTLEDEQPILVGALFDEWLDRVEEWLRSA